MLTLIFTFFLNLSSSLDTISFNNQNTIAITSFLQSLQPNNTSATTIHNRIVATPHQAAPPCLYLCQTRHQPRPPSVHHDPSPTLLHARTRRHDLDAGHAQHQRTHQRLATPPPPVKNSYEVSQTINDRKQQDLETYGSHKQSINNNR